VVAAQIVAFVERTTDALTTANDIDALILARAFWWDQVSIAELAKLGNNPGGIPLTVWRRGENEANILDVGIVELDRVTTALVEASGVIGGHAFAAISGTGCVVAELCVGCGADVASEGRNCEKLELHAALGSELQWEGK
jgi:hypothetical protein